MNRLNDLPRRKLREIVAYYGRSVGDDPKHCRNLLMDLCGDHRREVNLLVTVAEDRIAADLLTTSSIPFDMRIVQMTKRLYENRGLTEDFARWGIISWALALGLISEETAHKLDMQSPGNTSNTSAPNINTSSVNSSVPSHPPTSLSWQSQLSVTPPQVGQPAIQPPTTQTAPITSPNSLSIHPTLAISGKTVLTYREHTLGVGCVAWSPDGMRIASGGADNVAHVWEAFTGRTIYSYKGHKGFISEIRDIAWSPSGTHIATADDDRTVQIWRAENGNCMTIYRGHSKAASCVAWSPDGMRIVSGSIDKTVQVWDAKSAKPIFTFSGHKGVFAAVKSVAWSPDARLIASTSEDEQVQVWKADNGSHIFTYKEHSNWMEAVAWSPDSLRIASGSWDKTVQIWNAETGSYRTICRGHTKTVTAVAWSPDRRCVASASEDKTVRIWNAETGQHLFTFSDHSKKVCGVAWSPDGKYIASASADNTVRVWALW